jgi:hypothetical protein
MKIQSKALYAVLALVVALGLALSLAGPSGAQGGRPPDVQLAVLLDGSYRLMG